MVDRDVAESSTGETSKPATTPWTLRYVAETGSTNSDLLALARAGAVDRTVLRTDHQTAGRGRLDRRWSSPPGTNLMASLLFRDVPEDPTELTRRVGVAAVEAVRTTTGREPVLKWPNDLLLDGHKLAGILAQRDHTDAAVRTDLASPSPVVVGIGVNTGWSPDGAIDLGSAVAPADLLDELLAVYDRLPVDAQRFHDVYRSHLATLGQRVRVELPTGERVGRAVDIDLDGRLMIVDDCAVTHRIDVGDVVHVRRDVP